VTEIATRLLAAPAVPDDVGAADPAGAVAERDDHLLLFNTATYHRLNLEDGERSLRIDVRADDRLVGTTTGVLAGDVFCSGHRAPFGGPDFVRNPESVDHVGRLVDETLTALAVEGARTVRIRARSECHSPTEPTLQFALLNAGFTVEACELNFHIALGGLRDGDDYIEALKSPARRALRHSHGAQLAFTEPTTDGEWAAAYSLIARNRKAKGRPMGLPFTDVIGIRNAFPGRIRMYTVLHAGRICAAALVYRVRPAHDYVVAWGDDHDLPRSPMNFLAYRLVLQDISEGVTVMDLGISSDAGRPNPGLIQFKQSILARPTLRLDLVKTLS
jgi:hypothetical protein